MKIVFLGLILLVSASVGDESRLNRTTTRYMRRKNRFSSATEFPENWSTTESEIEATLTTRTTAKSDTLNDKIESLLSGKNGCGLLKINSTIPWVVVIEHSDPTGKDKRKTLSKGALISDQYVLTTVSSVHNSHPFWVVSGVRLGDIATSITDGTQRNVTSFTHVGIDHVYQHRSKDIAVIRLDKRINFTDYIQPLCLPIDDNYNFREMYFHRCQRSPLPERKLTVQLLSSQPLTPQDCQTMFHRKGADFGADEFCSWDEFGDNCMGDVGGPLMANFNGRYLLIGLNSYAVAEEEFEADDYPGVYVKVGSFLKWIKGILQLSS